MKRLSLVVLLSGWILVICLPGHGFALVEPRGSDWTHDIATWNWQNFPLNGNLTVNYLVLLIRDLELDLLCVQEIESEDDFSLLVNNIGGWDGIIGGTGQMLTGVLFNTSKVSIDSFETIWDDAYFAFPRGPIKMHVTFFENGDTLKFNLINVHLKAGGAYEDDNLERRRAACDSLKTFMDYQVAHGNPMWMVIGDFNDTLNDSPQINAFNVFLDDPQSYIFLTEPLSHNVYNASHITTSRLIDHILITEDLMSEYQGGHVETMRLDQEWNFDLYTDNVSDHRPVGAFFPGAFNQVGDNDPESVPVQTIIEVWPVPSNSGVTIRYSLPSGSGYASIYDLTGRLLDEFSLAGYRGSRFWNGTNSSGFYFIQLNSGASTSHEKFLLVK